MDENTDSGNGNDTTKDLTPTERAAIVTWAIYHGEQLTIKDVMSKTGLSYSGASRLMLQIERVIPIYKDTATKLWLRVN